MEAIKIDTKTGINNIHFGMSEEAVNALDYPKDLFNVEFKNKKVVAISFRNAYQFSVNDQAIDLAKPGDFLTKFNPYFDGDTYIFPELHLAAFGVDQPQNGFEITAYDESLRGLYEKNLTNNPRYTTLQNQTEISAQFDVVPYQRCGPLQLGASPSAIIAAVGEPLRKAPRGADGLVLSWDKMIAKFEKEQLVQVTFENVPDIFLEGEDISKTGPAAKVLAGKELFPNRAYSVFFEVGLAFTGFDKPREAKTIIFFGESMKAIWSNTKRPLI